MEGDFIHIKGARVHNLRSVEVRLPRNRLTVVTGVSGSGKSSLAFDTLHAEGSRQYLESLSTKARGLLEALPRPDVDFIHGLSPVVAIAQRTSGGANPRSTVATVTEIADHARLLWSLCGERRCPKDGGLIRRRSLDDCLEPLLRMKAGTRVVLLAPIRSDKPSALLQTVEDLARRGFSRVRVDGEVVTTDEAPGLLTGRAERRLELVVDRAVTGPDQRSRLADSLELAFREGSGKCLVLAEAGGERRELALSLALACESCGETHEPLGARELSPNHPRGACPTCDGLGKTLSFREELCVADESLGVAEGVVKPWRLGTRKMLIRRNALVRALAEQVPFDPSTPWAKLAAATRRLLLEGEPRRTFLLPPPKGRKPVESAWKGMFHELTQVSRTTSSESLRQRLLAYQAATPCPACEGRRLSAAALGLRLGGLNLAEFLELTVPEALAFARGLADAPSVRPAEEARRGLERRLGFLDEAGLSYLTLAREFGTLSGGEAQRVRLASQLGLGLVGVTYVLDEPSIGLHPRDHARLIRSLRQLRDLGNTVIVVEHDREMVAAADHLVEMGPGAGEEGGRVVFEGTPAEAEASALSRAGAWLSGRAKPAGRRRLAEPRDWLTVRGATENNLKDIDLRLPVGRLTVLCGVSGSGKSTLALDVLGAVAARKINGAKVVPGHHRAIEGLERFDAYTLVDQEPIGRSPRSNPATFTGILDHLRDLWAATPLAKARGHGPGRFSANVRGGRCEACSGEGAVALDMQFLGETYVECPSCSGRRFNRETLEVRFKGLSIADALALSVREAAEVFRAQPRLAEKLRTLEEVGLGYLRLGQPATTLSGGEAQRLKLAADLARREHAGRLYLLDEPTTGLASDDVERLMALLFRLRDAGATLLVIEHHSDVIRAADWTIELGPEGGGAGGRLLHEGPPESLARADTPTGACLRG
jgi:excinuclease ABC subunit A